MLKLRHSPIRAARIAYNRLPRPQAIYARPLLFNELVGVHMAHGMVISTSELFMLLWATKKGTPIEQIADYSNPLPPEQCDTWFITLAAGDFKKAWHFDPLGYKYASWQRNGGRLRWVSLEHLKRKTHVITIRENTRS